MSYSHFFVVSLSCMCYPCIINNNNNIKKEESRKTNIRFEIFLVLHFFFLKLLGDIKSNKIKK
jgi:hypothetical protein